MKYIGLGICIFNFIKCTRYMYSGWYIYCSRLVTVVRLIFYNRVKRIIYLVVYVYYPRSVFSFKNNAPKTFKGHGKINNTNFVKIKLKYNCPMIDTVLLLNHFARAGRRALDIFLHSFSARIPNKKILKNI